MLTRRSFLTYIGMGTYQLLRSSPSFAAVFPTISPMQRRLTQPRQFTRISPSREDKLILPKGFQYDRIASYGDMLGSKGPLGDEFFGADNDFLAYFPFTALEGKASPDDGLLWVNHEYLHSLLVSGVQPKDKTEEQIKKEKLVVGGSVIRVQRKNKSWHLVKDAHWNQRYTAAYPEMIVTGPASPLLKSAVGTLANCSGGKTPWNTVLTCEENFQLFNPVTDLGWANSSATALDERQYGWVVEIDPFRKLPPKKHSSLGKFSHENAAIRIGANGRLVVYMGDDSKDQFFYKYVSHEKFQSKQSREQQSKLLESGTLYVADFINGKWLSLDLQANPKLKEAGFKSQGEVMMETRKAAAIVGGTPMDRPEDCEVHPKDGSVYIAFTNNTSHGNAYGQIVRLVEKGDDAESLFFRYEIYLAGGPQTGLGAPDNLLFDREGNLWVCCDVSSNQLKKTASGTGAYEAFGNNGLHFVPTSGPSAGTAYQFASAPVDAELTGPWFNEAQDTLFLSVQHPGEMTTDLSEPTSRWPLGGSALPLSSVVAIRGFKS